jgi:hypothetical protein
MRSPTASSHNPWIAPWISSARSTEVIWPTTREHTKIEIIGKSKEDKQEWVAPLPKERSHRLKGLNSKGRYSTMSRRSQLEAGIHDYDHDANPYMQALESNPPEGRIENIDFSASSGSVWYV